MSDYETFQKWAVEADEIISDRSAQRGSFILGVSRFELLSWSNPKKAAFMAAIAARRRLKMALDRLHADGLALVAIDAMNEMSDEAYGYIDTDTYASGYHDTEQPARMFSRENEQYTPYMYSDELSDSLRTLIAPLPAGMVEIKASPGRICIPLNKSGAINLGTLKDGDDVTFDPSPGSGVGRQMTDEAMAHREWQERYEKAFKDAVCCGTWSFTVPAGTKVPGPLTRARSATFEWWKGWQAIADDAPSDPNQSPLDAIGEDVLNTVIAPAKQGPTTAKPQAHTDPYFTEDEQRSMEPVEVWCKPKTGKAYRHAIRPRKAAEELVERNNSQYRGVAEYWIEP